MRRRSVNVNTTVQYCTKRPLIGSPDSMQPIAAD
jgi:hypothetical protein